MGVRPADDNAKALSSEVRLLLFIEQGTKFESVDKDRPGDIDPEKEEEQGGDTAVDRCIGFVVYHIEDKGAFTEIPDQ